MKATHFITFGTFMALVPMLAACGGGTTAGTTPSTPSTIAPPPPPPPPPSPPPPPPPVDYNTVEYLRSNAAVKVNALSAYDAGATGSGVTAAVIDSGVNPALSEFSGRISAESQDIAGTRGMGDEGGHGTSVAAVLLAARDDNQMQGVAFDATLLALRTDTPGSCGKSGLNGGCTHLDANIAKAVDIAVSNHARVINLSLGGRAPDEDLESAIIRATAAGVVIVISAGNDANDNPGEFALVANNPAAHGLILIAGGVDKDDQISTYTVGGSNKAGSGAAHYLLALGTSVRSINEQGAGIMGSGTSYAAPAISGAVALLADAFPNLTGAQIVELLLNSTKDLGAAGVDPIYGHGLLDLSAAFSAKGSTSVAGTQIVLSTSYNGMLSAPMGDAGQHGLSTIVLDSYGRAYRAQLDGSFSRDARQSRLWQSLSQGGQTAAMGVGATGMMLSVSNDHNGPTVGPLALTMRDRETARALAGWAVTRLSRQTQVAFGVGQRSGALVDQMAVRRAASFLLAEAAGDALGFAATPGFAMAVRHDVAGWGFSLASDRGNALVWDGLRRQAYDAFPFSRLSLAVDRTWGPFSMQVSGAQLREQATVLGAQFSPALGAPGAVTDVMSVGGALALGRNWNINGHYQQGWTRVAAGGLRPDVDHLGTTAWSLNVQRDDFLRRGDRFAFRVSQPVRVSYGGLGLQLARSWDYTRQAAVYERGLLNLAPVGREIDTEFSYLTPFLRGSASFGLFLRQDPGHDAAAPDDKGLAARLRMPF